MSSKSKSSIVSMTLSFLLMMILLPASVSAFLTISFDRTGNSVSDIVFSEGGQVRAMLFDNDEDGVFDYGLMDRTSDPVSAYTHLWIDKNGDGSSENREFREFEEALPYATFPSSMVTSSATSEEGILHFMDYTPDSAFMDEIHRDSDSDGDIEGQTLLFRDTAEGETGHYRLNFVDSDNDGDFDRGSLRSFYIDETGILLMQFRFPKGVQGELPVMHYPW